MQYISVEIHYIKFNRFSFQLMFIIMPEPVSHRFFFENAQEELYEDRFSLDTNLSVK